MKKRYILIGLLLSNFALFCYGLVWLGQNEPHGLSIQGDAYGPDSPPYIASRVKTAEVPEGELLARIVLIGDAGDPAEINRDNLAMLQRWSQE
jgi:hypothetical protein